MPDPSEILTLRTFLKGFTCNLTLSHFLGGPVKKTTLYKNLRYYLKAFTLVRVLKPSSPFRLWQCLDKSKTCFQKIKIQIKKKQGSINIL